MTENPIPPLYLEPAQSRVAYKKLVDLMASGYESCGVMIRRKTGDTVEYGAISSGGLVIWWPPVHTQQVPITQQPESPCACSPGRMCSRSAQCASDVKSDSIEGLLQPREGSLVEFWCHRMSQHGKSGTGIRGWFRGGLFWSYDNADHYAPSEVPHWVCLLNALQCAHNNDLYSLGLARGRAEAAAAAVESK